MFSFLKHFLKSFNPASNATFVGKQLKKPSGFFASRVAKGMNKSNKKLYDLMFQSMVLNNDENILEIGFGNGYFFEELSQKNPKTKIWGVEISNEMIDQCSRINKKLIADEKLNIKHYDGLTLPYADNMFDKAIAINLIYFWENPTENIRELHRVLKPSGELFIGVRPFKILNQLAFAQESFNIKQDHWWIEIFQMLGFQLAENLNFEEPTLQFNGKTHQMSGTCWIFKKTK
jgi:ubiquinone/menaquinone biosynthesis C-methylase UbiE